MKRGRGAGSGRLLRLKLMIAGMLCRLAAKHNTTEQSRAVNAAAAAAQCSLGVPVQVYPVASAWQLATGNGQQRLWGPDWAEL